jgi:predicted DNA-binding ribbon-helix-helix protein
MGLEMGLFRMERRHIGIGRDRTTIALEPAFWRQVDRRAEQSGKEWRELIAGMLKGKPDGFGRAGWLRVAILESRR